MFGGDGVVCGTRFKMEQGCAWAGKVRQSAFMCRGSVELC